MLCLAFIKDHNYPMIKLRPYEISQFPTFGESFSVEEIDVGIEANILSPSLSRVYNVNEFKSQGIYRLADDHGKILWEDKSEAISSSVESDQYQPIKISYFGGLYIKDVTIQLDHSELPQNLTLSEQEHLGITIECHSEGFGPMHIMFAGGGKFVTSKVTDLQICNTFTTLRVTCENCILSFTIQSPTDNSNDWTFSNIESIEQHEDSLREALLNNIKLRMSELNKLLDEVSTQGKAEVAIYKFYNKSYKTYYIQELTIAIYEAIRSLLPDRQINSYFKKIIEDGTGKQFSLEINEYWFAETAPMIYAFQHARYMLELIVESGKQLEDLNGIQPSSWGIVLCLFNLH